MMNGNENGEIEEGKKDIQTTSNKTVLNQQLQKLINFLNGKVTKFSKYQDNNNKQGKRGFGWVIKDLKDYLKKNSFYYE